MSPNASDFYRQKTDAELLFFVQNPGQYAPELVAGAVQELRHRGVAPTPAAYVPGALTADAEADAPRPWGRPVALGLVLLVIGGGTYWLKQHSDASAAAAQARAEAQRRLPPPKLVEEATHAIPNYGGVVARTVEQQVRLVPAAERADAQKLRQFRELTKRFWTAETQTEYLTGLADAGPQGPSFAAQALLARETWQAWNHANAYGFAFGPAMAAQLKRMNDAASNQQHILALLPENKDVTGQELAKRNQELASRTRDVQDLVGGLLPVSPVSGKPYKRIVLAM